MLPVSLENDLNPLGHSGQRKLQDVVGSIEILDGLPQRIGRFKILEIPNEIFRKT